ncbi:MAG TPA: FAD-dependent oxidoreductase [Solirubrobacterales bacterium]|nr:FAD-dependent oxidoreductase [Solirubrobacterales bacterium]
MKSRVLIVGGGVASIEAALALQDLAGERASVRIFSPRAEFVYRPYAVGEPYGAARIARYDLSELAPRCGAELQVDSVVSVDPDARLVTTYDGDTYAYDYLILAQGAKLLWPVPGAATFWGIADEHDVNRVLDGFRSGESRRLAFTMPGTESWALPMYELALLAETELRRSGSAQAQLTIVTPEEAPLQIFGRRASELVAGLLAERRIEVVTRTHPVRFEDGRLKTVPERDLEFDSVVSLPRLEGRRIRGALHDPEGFIRIDDHCRVLDRERLFAAGDVTSFPVKQGGIATQQADVIAEAIAADLGADLDPQPFDPVLRGVLWTGEQPCYLEGWIGGGHGEASSFTAEAPWGSNEGKIVGRYLTPFIAGLGAQPESVASSSAS